MGKRVVVGLSGGVDSSVAAYLLKKEGYDVIGVFMKNWHDKSVLLSNECPWVEDSVDAIISAQHIGIPFHTIDLSKSYKKLVVDYMFREYQQGRTPNPDVLCNREIKFALFRQTAQKLGADYIATGHYCIKDIIKKKGQTIYRLKAGKDKHKDQSYFLCQLSQNQIKNTLFPLGHLTKKMVRSIAKKIGLPNAHKKDSQGLCFVGKVHLPKFLQQQLSPKKGDVVKISADSKIFKSNEQSDDLCTMTAPYTLGDAQGNYVGQHQGAHYYTVGQRKGLGIGGNHEPLFILGTDVKKNIVYTGLGTNHPGLYRKGFFVSDKETHWMRPDMKVGEGEEIKCKVRIRYRQPLENCKLIRRKEGLYTICANRQKGIASGQFAVWYWNDEVIGSGVIC